MKKIVFIALSVSLFLVLASQLDVQRFSKVGCAFCDPEILESQVFYRSNGVLGILTHKPAVPGHVLVIPERHVERFEELTSEEIAALGEVIKKVDVVVRRVFGYEDYVLLQKNGIGAGQSVPHVHFHYLPGTKFLPFQFFLSPWLKPLKSDELRHLRDLLSEEFSGFSSIHASRL